MESFRQILDTMEELSQDNENLELYDSVDIELSDDLLIETGIVGFLNDGVILEADDKTVELLEFHDMMFDEISKLEISEAEYQGRKVELNKPMQGDIAKSKVYVRKPNGKVVKVNFGDKNMRIKKSNPARRRSFRARHRCDTPGPKWKARYWSCRAW